jgi:hypothetical protein
LALALRVGPGPGQGRPRAKQLTPAKTTIPHAVMWKHHMYVKSIILSIDYN